MAQSGIRDSVIHFPYISIGYGLSTPGGDLKDRFGITSMLSGNFIYKTSKNFIFGISGGFLFGDKVKEEGLLDAISTENDQVIGLDGLYADVRLFERGYHFSATVGKIFSFKKPNPNSGILISGGPGFIQHKIRIEDIGHNVPQLEKDYLKGYDRLTNGIELTEFIGYIYFGNRQLINFFAGIECIQAFTENRRDYNFNQEVKEKKRVDLLYGIKAGWVLPLYKKKPAAYYLY
jgi:hypothetical protein